MEVNKINKLDNFLRRQLPLRELIERIEKELPNKTAKTLTTIDIGYIIWKTKMVDLTELERETINYILQKEMKTENIDTVLHHRSDVRLMVMAQTVKDYLRK